MTPERLKEIRSVLDGKTTDESRYVLNAAMELLTALDEAGRERDAYKEALREVLLGVQELAQKTLAPLAGGASVPALEAALRRLLSRGAT